MTAYENALFEDLAQRDANGETLSPRERRELNSLFALQEQAWETAMPRYLDHGPDAF